MRVPVLGEDRGTLLHRRDPRVKLLLFAVLVAFLYIAPSWPWMVAATLVGLGMAVSTKMSGKVLLLLWLLQLPNFLALIVIPLSRDLIAGDLSPFDGNLAFGLKLGFAWSAALFVSISLLTTMTVDQLTDGLRGLKVPEPFCFLVGYAFLLMYASLADLFRTVDAMKLKGIELRLRRPVQAIRNVVKLMVPAIIIMVRRAGTMMSVLQLRGFSFTRRRQTTTLTALGAADITLLLAGVLVGGVALAARIGLLPALT